MAEGSGGGHPIAVEAFFQPPAIRAVKLSPSGKQLAFTTGRGREHVGLAVMDLDGEPHIHWVAGFSDADVGRFEWVNDERLIYTAIDLNEGSAEDYYTAPGLFSAKVDGTESRQLVWRKNKPLVVGAGFPRDILEWNHVLLDTTPRASDEVIVGRLEIVRGEVAAVRPFWLNVRTGHQRPIDMAGSPDHVVHWVFDPDGVPLAAMTRDEGREAVYWRDSASAPWRRLAEAPQSHLPFEPLRTDGQGRLYITRSAGEGRWQALTTYDFKTGAPADKDLISAPGFDIEPRLVVDAGTHALLGAHLETDADTTVWYDPALKKIQQRVDALLPAWVNRIECRRCGSVDRVVLVHSYSAQDPGRVWLYRDGEEGTKALRPLSVAMPDLSAADMASKSFERIKARDGEDLPVWTTLPRRGPKDAAPPAVVLVHGGPWVRGGHWRWDPMTQFLASRGYAVIEPEFRGSAGYGERHERAGDRQWGLSMQSDVADALRWAQKKGLVGDRACIMGASYGGYAVLMGLVRDPDLYRCGIEWVGVADLELFLKGSWWIRDDVSDSGRKFELPERVGRLLEDADLIRANDPVLLADRIHAPLLMAYGDGDLRVPVVHGERMRDALRKAGQSPEWIVYAHEGHGWRLEKNQIDFARRVERFLAQYLPIEPQAGAPNH